MRKQGVVARFRYSGLKEAVCDCGRRGSYANSIRERLGLRHGEAVPGSTAHDLMRTEIGSGERGYAKTVKRLQEYCVVVKSVASTS